MAAHTKAQREFIVRRLAAFETPRDIAYLFPVCFPDTACTENDVQATDPRNVLLDPSLCEIFSAERERVLVEAERLWPGLPETLKILLIGMSRDVETLRNRYAFDLANKTAAEIAKIVNGFYSSKAAKLTVDDKDKTTTFTFGLDRAEQD